MHAVGSSHAVTDPIVTHAFNFVGRGALGLFQAGDGGELPGADH